MPHQPNPMMLAEAAQRMAHKAEHAEAKLFQKVALVSMGAVAFGSIAQVLLELLRRHDRPDRSR